MTKDQMEMKDLEVKIRNQLAQEYHWEENRKHWEAQRKHWNWIATIGVVAVIANFTAPIIMELLTA